MVRAEISVAMAGFAGIIAAIGTSDRLEERQEIRALVVGVASVVLGSLLPLLLSAAPNDVISIWRIASRTCLPCTLAYYAVGPRERFQSIGASKWYPVFIGGDIVMQLGLGLVGFGYAGELYSALIDIGWQFWILFQVPPSSSGQSPLSGTLLTDEPRRLHEP